MDTKHPQQPQNLLLQPRMRDALSSSLLIPPAWEKCSFKAFTDSRTTNKCAIYIFLNVILENTHNYLQPLRKVWGRNKIKSRWSYSSYEVKSQMKRQILTLPSFSLLQTKMLLVLCRCGVKPATVSVSSTWNYWVSFWISIHSCDLWPDRAGPIDLGWGGPCALAHRGYI